MSGNFPVVITGEQYEHFNGRVNRPVEAGLMSLAAADIDAAHGGTAAESAPVKVEVTPYYIDRAGFLVRSVHRLNDFDISGGFQLHEFSFGLEHAGRNTVARTDSLRHALPGETAVFLSQLGLAAKNASRDHLLVSSSGRFDLSS